MSISWWVFKRMFSNHQNDDQNTVRSMLSLKRDLQVAGFHDYATSPSHSLRYTLQ